MQHVVEQERSGLKSWSGVAQRHHLQLAAVLVVAAAFRFWHLDWGTDSADGRFHGLHPDERGLIHAAGLLAESLKPALSSYGALSLYLPWATWPLAQVLSVELFDEANRRGTFVMLRALSATAALFSVVLTWMLGCRLADERAGLLAASLLAVATLSIQQAHYYTVDGLVTTTTLVTVLLCLRALERDRWIDWLGIGVAVGLTAGLRINGLILMAPAIVAAALGADRNLRRTFMRCIACAGAALATLLLLQPYMILDPMLYFGRDGVGNLVNAAAIATGKIPRIWTLYDSAQTPYWYHLTSLMAHAVGPALQVAGLAGLLWLANRRRSADLVCLAFVLSFVLVIGRLEAKNIRYLTPMIPFLCVSAGVLITDGYRQAGKPWRQLAVAATAICLISSSLYAFAYVRVYGQIDPRIESLDHIRKSFVADARIGYEHTGVSLSELVRPEDQFRWDPDPLGALFNLDRFLLSSEKVAMVYRWLHDVDGVVIVDVARMRHFAAVADRYPIEAEFYQELFSGRAGFEIIADVDRGPGLGPWSLTFRSSDPSFDGFDHPRVTVLRRTTDQMQHLASSWVGRLQSDPAFIDKHLLAASRAMKLADLESAGSHLDIAAEIAPQHRLPLLFRCEILLRQGRDKESDILWKGMIDEMGTGAGSFWQHESVGLQFAGATLNKLGASVIGQRCLETAAKLGT
jgi:hypothetical protein